VGNGLSDHELLMEVREDVAWIKDHLSQYPTRKEIYGVLATVMTLGVAILAAIV